MPPLAMTSVGLVPVPLSVAAPEPVKESELIVVPAAKVLVVPVRS